MTGRRASPDFVRGPGERPKAGEPARPGARGRAADPRRGGTAGERLRPLGAPRAAEVVLDPDGTPAAVMVGRRLRGVCAVRERWRIDDEWWRTPLARDYLTVVLQDGRPLTLYHDLVKGGWWVQGEEG